MVRPSHSWSVGTDVHRHDTARDPTPLVDLAKHLDISNPIDPPTHFSSVLSTVTSHPRNIGRKVGFLVAK
jgi:hypothetical protein